MSLFSYGPRGNVFFKIYEVFVPKVFLDSWEGQNIYWPARLPEPTGDRCLIVGTAFRHTILERAKFSRAIIQHFGIEIDCMLTEIFFLQSTDGLIKNPILPIWLYPLVVRTPMPCATTLLHHLQKTQRTPEIEMAIDLLVQTKDRITPPVPKEIKPPKSKSGKRSVPSRKRKNPD